MVGQATVDPIGVGSEFHKSLRLLQWGIDTVNGDNPLSNSIVDHGVVDADMLKFELDPPGIFLDWQQGNQDVPSLAAKYDLLGLPRTLRNILLKHKAQLNKVRYDVLLREISIAEVLLHCSLDGKVTGVTAPPFEDRWSAVTGAPPPALSSFDPELRILHGKLIDLLAKKGVDMRMTTIRAAVTEWEHSHPKLGTGDIPQISGIIDATIKKYFPLFQEFAARIPALQKYAGQLTTEHFSFKVLEKMTFDAGSSYIGGNNTDGTPALASFIEWNAGRPASAVDIEYVTIHEMVHAIEAQLMDLQRRDGQLGPESALLTMSSARVCNSEGLAQTALEILYGGFDKVVEAMGVDTGIVIILDQLQDMARLVAAVGWNAEWVKLEELQRLLQLQDYIRTNLLQDEHIVNKYAGADRKWWRGNIGGQMHAASYYYGSRAYRAVLAKNSPEMVFAAGVHVGGLMDLQSFKQTFSLA